MNLEVIGLRLKYEKEIIKQYKSALQSIRSEMLRIAERYSKNGVISKSDALLYARDKGLIENINNELSKLGENIFNIEVELQKELYKQGYFISIYNIDKETGFSFTVNSVMFSQLNTSTIEKLIHGEAFLNAIKNLSEKTKRNIKTSITQGIIQGKSIPDISKMVKDDLGNATNSALLIARTETHKALESGSLDAYGFAEDNGVKITKQWVATKDDRTRPDHQEMDGKTAGIEVDGEFYFQFPDGTMTLGPGLSGVASEDLNCRCSTIAIIDDYKTSTMRVGKEIESYKNYKDWAKAKVDGII